MSFRMVSNRAWSWWWRFSLVVMIAAIATMASSGEGSLDRTASYVRQSALSSFSASESVSASPPPSSPPPLLDDVPSRSRHRMWRPPISPTKLRCYEERAPTSSTVNQLHPLVSVVHSLVQPSNSSMLAFFGRGVSGTTRGAGSPPSPIDRAAVICTSLEPPNSRAPTQIPCPFMTGQRPDTKVLWKFYPLSTGPDFRLKAPAQRHFYGFLHVGNLQDFDQGYYECTSTDSSGTSVEVWTIVKANDSWRFLWHDQTGGLTRAYRLRDSQFTVAT